VTTTLELHADADEAARDGDYWGALRHAADILHTDPDDHRARTKLALSLAALGHPESALVGLTAGAESLMTQGYLLSALAMVRDAMGLAPDDERLAALVARIHELGTGRDLSERPRVPPPTPPTVAVEGRVFQTLDRESLLDRAIALVESPPQVGEPPLEGRPLPFFGEIQAAALADLLPRCRMRRASAGTVVVEEGGMGDALFVIVRGEVEVTVEGKLRARLGPGALFGEMALFIDRPRGATVTALQPAELFEIPRVEVEQLAVTHPELTDDLAQFARRRMLTNAVASSAIFKVFQPDVRRRFLAAFGTRIVQAGEVVIREGERTRGLFVVVEGQVEVSKDDGGEKVVVAYLDPGEVFGEISLVWDDMAVATVTAVDRAVLLVLPAEAFASALEQAPEARDYLADLSVQRIEDLERALEGEEVLDADDLILV
jgi:CRP-like cAMP-binding protein